MLATVALISTYAAMTEIFGTQLGTMFTLWLLILLTALIELGKVTGLGKKIDKWLEENNG